MNDNIYLEKKEEFTHSLTPDEVTIILKNNCDISKNSVREYRKNYIIKLLEEKNINIDNVDIDDIINGNIPDWLVKIENNTSIDDKVMSGLFGFVVGDALGVPLEFTSRNILKNNFITDMIGYGSHNMPDGTWSDDTSLTLATMDSIIQCGMINYRDIMDRFLYWYERAHYTANDIVFDIGLSTEKAIVNYKKGIDPIKCGGLNVNDNGNGSLMRMLPIVFVLNCQEYSEFEKVNLINNLSSLTHAHEISRLGCKIYVDYMSFILNGFDKLMALDLLKKIDYSKYYSMESIIYYNRILSGDIKNVTIGDIKSSGFVVDTLEASIWCTITSNSYSEAVLKAINLGDDTDTIGAITGSINGVIYGGKSIPNNWLNKIKRREYLENLAINFSNCLKKNKLCK